MRGRLKKAWLVNNIINAWVVKWARLVNKTINKWVFKVGVARY